MLKRVGKEIVSLLGFCRIFETVCCPAKPHQFLWATATALWQGVLTFKVDVAALICAFPLKRSYFL